MKKNKVILKHCPNFHKIVNFGFFEDDLVTAKLITLYQDFIFKIDYQNLEEIKMVEKFDFVLNKYIEDYYFRYNLRQSLKNLRIAKKDNYVKSIVEGIIDSFETYETGYTRNIYFARWI